ncbi:hypothetical protein [Methylocystis heyeri]|uniref:Uncharacterized protein n=1 Tax=Methylocystis heyeri TaxID=391905 RepID=A0A6B8KIS2_9HYPH|nr:hypothetical protein [Methylocystis heyeri]QGM47572.1 hypothetical protein H2LOC_018845 [Methylocystis heyeri]
MSDFRRVGRDAKGSLLWKTAWIAGATALLSVLAAGLLSNISASEGDMKRLAGSAPAAISRAVQPARSWAGIDDAATATIRDPRSKSPSAACANMARIVTTYRTIGPDGEIVTITDARPRVAGAPACAE